MNFSITTEAMTNKIHLYLLLLTMFQGFSALGQSLSVTDRTITWTSVNSITLNESTGRQATCTFKTFGSERVELTQGSSTRTLTITNVSGTWIDINTPGKVSFNVTYGDVTGTMVIEKDLTGTSILLDFTGQSENGLKRKYIVSSTELH